MLLSLRGSLKIFDYTVSLTLAVLIVWLIHHNCVYSSSVASDSEAPWTVACQAPLSMGFSRQEDISNPGFTRLSLAMESSVKYLSPGSDNQIENQMWFSKSLNCCLHYLQEYGRGLDL